MATSTGTIKAVETSRGAFAVRCFGPLEDPANPPAKGTALPVVFYVHGAGMSSMGFAPCANMLLRGDTAEPPSPFPIRSCGIDLRGHGETVALGGAAQGDDFALTNLVEDVAAVIDVAMETLYCGVGRCYVVGHSLGGAIVSRVCHHKLVQPRLSAAVVVDVVEGTAKAALRSMKTFLDQRPKSFKTTDEAVMWFLRQGGMRNRDSAALEVPTLLDSTDAGEFVWKTDLAATSPFWEGWFEELDAKFVSIPGPKMLLLAGADRLDTQMTVAQMQGKFQFEVVGGDCGHYVLEDAPAACFSKIQRLVKRVDKLTKILPPPIIARD